MKSTFQKLSLFTTITLLASCGGGGDSSTSSGVTSGAGTTTDPSTESSDFEYPDEFYFIGNNTQLGSLFKQKINMTYFYLSDRAAAFGAQSPFFAMNAGRIAVNDPAVKEISCEVGSVTMNGDEIYASMWNFVVFNQDCERPVSSSFHGKITVNQITQSGADEGNIVGVIGSIANATPFYHFGSDGLSSRETKGYLGDYSKIYDDGSRKAYSVNIGTLRLSNYLADTQPNYDPNSSSDLTKTIRDYSQKTNEDSKLESLKFSRTWTENGRDFTIKFDGSNLDPEAGTGSYTFTLDESGSNLHDVTFNANFHGTYMILTHTLNGVTQSSNIEFY